MILYHITKEKYLPLIFTEGLRINTGKTGFCPRTAHRRYKRAFGMQPIFLTNRVNLIRTMLTPDWIIKNKAVLLEVDVELIKDVNYNAGGFILIDDDNNYIPTEYRYLEDIQPKNIRLNKKMYLEL